MTIYALIEKYVNGVRHHNGQAPKQNRALQAFIGAHLLRERLLGIDTATQAAIATGVTRAVIINASLILQSENAILAAYVLSGGETLSGGAKAVRGRVRLVEAFKAASPEDRVGLGHAVGASVLFDAAIAPAL
jgi:hypothetical protein